MTELLKLPEVAQMFDVSRSTVREWVKQGKLEVIVLPHAVDRYGSRRFKRETVEKLLSERSCQKGK